MPNTARVFDERMPSSAEIANANELRSVLAGQIRDNEETHLKLALDTGTRAEVILMPALAKSLMEILRYVGSGKAVTIVPTDEMLTTQQAADILNVSRPFLIKLLERGDLKHVMTGRHRRIRAQDVFNYKHLRDDARAAALSKLAKLDAELI